MKLSLLATVIFVTAIHTIHAQGPQLILAPCSPTYANNQEWYYNTTDTRLYLKHKVGNQFRCMDIDSYSTQDNATVYTYQCACQACKSNQYWNVTSTYIQSLDGGNKCLSIFPTGFPVSVGSIVTTDDCDSQQDQQFVYSSTTGQIVHTQTGLCVDAGTTFPPCRSEPFTSYPFCNVSLSMDDRISDLISRIPDAEKWGMFDTTSSGSPTLQIPSYQWWSEALHGVAGSPGVMFDSIVPGATSFPQVQHSSMAWNTSLWLAIGQTIATEARAMNNVQHAGNTFWAPNINIFREPRWGRGQETPGEDPFLTAQYVRNFVRGMQEGEDPRYIKASACAKHYAAYSLENWEGIQRYAFNAIVPDQDLVDTYLPAFQAAVQDARVSGIMCSYNAVNSVPSCANTFLLNEIARNEWSFDGYITSDCGAVSDILDPTDHHYVNTTDQLDYVVLSAGMDIGCDGQPSASIAQAYNDSAVSMDLIDTALTHLFRVRFRLGQFDPPSIQPYTQIPLSVICSADHMNLALEAAREGITLIKNTNKVLPLSQTSIKNIAAIGPTANNGGAQQGNYYGSPCDGDIITISDGLGNYGTVNYVQGCAINDTNTAGIPAAVTAAQAADATIIVVGLDQSQESEGNDRYFIELPGVQPQLVSQVCAASKGPCIVIVMAGGSVDISGLLSNSQVDAMLWVSYPGEAGGQAIAEALFGDIVPAGRLTQTIYPADFTNQVSMYEMGVRPGPSIFPPGTTPGRTYRFYTGTPVLPFAYGLSYTTFTYGISGPSRISLAVTHQYLQENNRYGAVYAPLSSNVAGQYTVNVTNTGTLDADDVVTGFLVPPGAGQNGVPLQELFGFQRVFVPAGQTVTVWLGVTARDLTLVSKDLVREAVSGEWTLRIGVKETGTYAEMKFIAE